MPSPGTWFSTAISIAWIAICAFSFLDRPNLAAGILLYAAGLLVAIASVVRVCFTPTEKHAFAIIHSLANLAAAVLFVILVLAR